MAERPKEFTVRRGGTRRFTLRVRLGETIDGMECSGALKELEPGRNDVDQDTEVAVAFEIEDFAGDSERGPGWFLLLSATATAQLEAGKRYLADARVVADGEPYISRSWIIIVTQPASAT